MIVTAGITDVSVYFYIIQDASATSPGEPVTGLLFSDIETGGSASYCRQGAARTDFSLITLASASAAHADGGFILVDDTNMPGLYRCDVPDAAFAAGAGIDHVFIQLVVASGQNAVVTPLMIEITDFDMQTASVAQTGDNYARLGAPIGASISADLQDVPTVSEFDARTLIAASYFDPAADTVALVTNLTNLPSIPTNWLTAAGINASALDGKGDWNLGKSGYALTVQDWNVGKTGYSVNALAANTITAASIAANAMDGKGNWNIGKTGYSLSQSFPTNFADMAITASTGRVTVGTMIANVIDAASIAASALDGKGNWNLGKTGYSLTTPPALASVCTEARLSELDAATGGKMANQMDIVQTDTTTDIPALLPSALVGGRMDCSVGAMAANVITAAAINSAALTAAKFAAGAIDAAALATDAVNEIRDAILPTQNAAFDNLEFLFVATSDHVTPVTAASGMAVTRSIDGGSFGSGTGTGPAEVGNGIYQYDASAADMNGGVITFRFVATGGTPGAPDDVFITIVTGGGV